MKKEFNLHLYAVTDRHWLRGRTLASQVREVLEGGATIVQIREKHLGDVDFLAEAREIQSICGEFNVPLIINDNVEVARAIGAGRHGLPRRTGRTRLRCNHRGLLLECRRSTDRRKGRGGLSGSRGGLPDQHEGGCILGR